jgi:nitrite reductase (NADH) large subunit
MEDYEVCSCNSINKSTIVKAIKEKGLTTLEEVKYETTAGSVCGGCCEEIEEILKETKRD